MDGALKRLGIEAVNPGVFNGGWCGSSDRLESVSPIDGKVLASVTQATAEEYEQTVAAAAKAFAGRGGRRVAQRSLQCFGAISFTDEHAHHRYLRRIHTLDAVLGSTYELERELGAALAGSGIAPRGIEVWRP